MIGVSKKLRQIGEAVALSQCGSYVNAGGSWALQFGPHLPIPEECGLLDL